MSKEVKNLDELVVSNDKTANGDLTKDNINTLVSAGIIPKNTPTDQISVFAAQCKELGLSPFSKEIYLIQIGSKYLCILGIGGARKLAHQSGDYAGCDEIKFNLKSDGSYQTLFEISEKYPKSNNIEDANITATCTVRRIINGHIVEFSHTVRMSEFNKKIQKWNEMPYQMIGKVAEMHALKKAFCIGSNMFDESEVVAVDENKTTPNKDDNTPITPINTHSNINIKENKPKQKQINSSQIEDAIIAEDAESEDVLNKKNDTEIKEKPTEYLNTAAFNNLKLAYNAASDNDEIWASFEAAFITTCERRLFTAEQKEQLIKENNSALTKLVNDFVIVKKEGGSNG